MARIDHVFARRTESKREQRMRTVVTQISGYRFVDRKLTSPQHKQGSAWWRERFADLVERRKEAK